MPPPKTRMAVEFRREIPIVAEAETIWQVLADLESWPEWTASMLRVELLGSTPPRVGSGVRIKQPKLPHSTLTITRWQPGAGFEWGSQSPGLTTKAAHWIHDSDGSCRVELWIRFDGILAPLIGQFLGPLIDSYVSLEAEGLKRRCEGFHQN